MRGVTIAAGAGVYSDPVAFGCSEAIENAVVQVNKCVQHSARWIELQCQSAFSEVDLHARSVAFQTLANVLLRFTDEIFQERFPRIPIDATLRIEQTQS